MKKRKFTYQEPPSLDVKLNKLFQGATKSEPTGKRKKEESELKIRLNFQKKNQEELSRKESKQRQATQSHICDICKLLIN